MAEQFDKIPDFTVTVNGVAVSDTNLERIVEIVVEQSVYLPAMFTIRLMDVSTANDPGEVTDFGMFDADAFPIGAEVDIQMGEMSSLSTVIKGEITGLELDANADSPPSLTVRGYARAHRLHRGRQNRSFQDVTDSDLVSTIASEAGLTAQADATSEVFPYVYQGNQTNWEFLRERAARIGFELYVDDRTLHFRSPQSGQQQGPALIFGEELLSFRVRMSTSAQAAEVQVRGWDVTAKEAIVGTATAGTAAPAIGLTQTGAQMAATFGEAKVVIVDRPVVSQDQANSLAQAVYDSLDGAFVQAEGVAEGDTSITPGKTLDISRLGTRLSGTYYVTSATHRMNAQEGYQTSFTVSGRTSDSLLELLAQGKETSRFSAVVVGVVTDNTDSEENLGRVKVKFPWLAESDQSWWARVASPMAGPDRGFFFLPEVNDEVLLAFEHGDITRPFVVGSLWNGQDAPPKPNSEAVADSKVNLRIIKTRAGHVITLDDTDGAEMITIVDKTGKNSIKIESASNKITIEADGDIAVTSQANVNVTAQQDAKISVQGNASMQASGNVEVKATGNATVSAQGNATVTAQAALEMKGATVKLEAQGTMDIKAGGPITIKGALINLN